MNVLVLYFRLKYNVIVKGRSEPSNLLEIVQNLLKILRVSKVAKKASTRRNFYCSRFGIRIEVFYDLFIISNSKQKKLEIPSSI